MATSTTTTLSNNVNQVYQPLVDFAFQENVQFASQIIANGKEAENGRDAQPGSPVTFTIYDNLNTNTTSLSETAGGTAESIANSQITVNLLEKGNYVTTTEKLRLLSFDNIDASISQLIGVNSAASTDQYAMEVAETQTGSAYVTYGQQGQRAGKSTIVAADTLDTTTVHQTYATLEAENAPKVQTENGEFYLWFIHPDVKYDLMVDSGNGTWNEFSLYGATDERINGEIGAYGGFRFIVTDRVKVDYVAGEEKQAATTVSGAHSAGDTVISMVDGSGMDAGNVININDGTDDYAYLVSSRSTNDVTIDRAIRKNGFKYYAASGSGLVTALSGGEAAEESDPVYSNYAVGADAFAYAYAVRPEIRMSEDNTDPYGRLARVAWYALHGIAEYKAESLHKVYTSVSAARNPNS